MRLHFIFGTLLFALSISSYAATEKEVHAVLVSKFVDYTTWPSEMNSYVLCVVEDSETFSLLSQVVGKRSGGKSLTTKFVNAGEEDFSGCQIVFIGGDNADGILQSVAGQSILTIANQEGFAASGGMINLVNRDGRPAFEVNLNQVEKVKLKMSSKLLSAAIIVE